MKILFAVVALLILALVVLVILKKRGSLGAGETEWPFYAKKPLTQPEQVLYHRLVTAMAAASAASFLPRLPLMR